MLYINLGCKNKHLIPNNQIFGAGGNVRGYPPCSLTKYPSATKHEERQVIDPMNLSSQALHL